MMKTIVFILTDIVGLNDFDIENDVNGVHNDLLDCNITIEKIKKAIQSSKNNKLPGENNVINEFLSSSFEKLSDIYVPLFNLIFETGIVPESCLTCMIIPIFKNKGTKATS